MEGWQVSSEINGDSCEPPLKRAKTSVVNTTAKSFVPVVSALNNLRRLELAVTDGLPMLLEGPIGCGKTTLVEHLAEVMGRARSPQLMKLQLGDQMDSKALLGTYCCTDIPGQFIWQPGCLLSAVTHGHWLLLEDLDCAPMDVISILVPLLEHGTLSVPGHGDQIRASPDFRLFATRRVVMSTTSWHRQRGSSSDLLDKLWTRVWVEPLSADELIKVIETRFPVLSKSAQKLIEIYIALTARHQPDKNDKVEAEDVDALNVEEKRCCVSFGSRPISTRDLIKWCARLERHAVERRSKLTTDLLFTEAVDCFCANLPMSGGHVELAKDIGKLLNFSHTEVEHHCFQRQLSEPIVVRGSNAVSVGREILKRTRTQALSLRRSAASKFSFTRPALVLMERIAVAVANNESVLLVGETGTGKTSAVQYLAEVMCHSLHVVNMNQQSDSMDLLGGFKPMELKLVVEPVKNDFEALVRESFPKSDNRQFFVNIEKCFSRKSWAALFQLMKTPWEIASKTFETGSPQRLSWDLLGARILKLQQLSEQIKSAPPFQFVEGTLVKALKQGDWILLDEINLASAELLECLSGLLESTSGSVLLTERGDVEPVIRHPDFRLFACMNPATDVGKKDLPLGIRNRFTEFFVDELDSDADLRLLARTYLSGLCNVPVKGIVDFYQQVRKTASTSLFDGTGRRPHYSLRTLCRALRQASRNVCGDTGRSVYEAFALSFLTQLSRSCYPDVDQLIRKKIFIKSPETVELLLKRPLPQPQDGRQYVLVEGYWIPKGPLELPVEDSNDYILTASVRANLRDLARIVSAGRLPVLLQGETSVGKTSLIKYLARLTGNVCHRINNHEHTDIQEYIGCYTASEQTGRLVFCEGVLVKAMREGHWIILDELNLAPSDVLEALNRLLDDNRELRIPETQQVVQAKEEFVLFATQNPPGHYGGRKVLSRAFRNRFVELHFDEIASAELEEILQKRCQLPQSYSRILVQVMMELQKRRRASGLFTGKQGYMTLRDLFRWGERFRLASDEEKSNGKQLLAENGYMLLAGRVRHCSEAAEIAEVLESAFKCKVDPHRLFTISNSAADGVCESRRSSSQPLTWPLLKQLMTISPCGFENVVWTYSMRRMALMVEQALRFSEPVLLVGETGCGKTTVCQMYAARQLHKLRSVNCNLHTESSDFLGGLRPVRHHTEVRTDESASRKLFEWHDGPLVEAMKAGSTFLIDEISLADDSVLERLNSVLEPERTLLLTERGTSSSNDAEQVVALPGFRVIATMNPGGDYGKKELSPALRNRFTEIWCPLSHGHLELVDIIEHNLSRRGISHSRCDNIARRIGDAMVEFVKWFQEKDFGKKRTVTVRDLLAWVDFICTTVRPVSAEASQCLELDAAYVHGACIVLVDCLSSPGDGSSANGARTECINKLSVQTAEMFGNPYAMDAMLGPVITANTSADCQLFGIPPFFIKSGHFTDAVAQSFSFSAPSTHQNVVRVLRALQLPRPILLEGSPGVGKTSLVAALAKTAGHKLIRINLSEQTDISDLFGADLPVEGGRSGEFAWRDGPFLAALRAGHWIVLDEMNLASQSVLEGLNACFDHRAEIYVPELGASFRVEQQSTRFFACQNPVGEGGGRKCLPRSFLNRFTQVYIDPLTTFDLLFIVRSAYPQLPETLITSMVEFNQQLHAETSVHGSWGHKGGPWEFNLRDLFRWCDLLVTNLMPGNYNAGEFVELIYADRMRSSDDKMHVIQLFEKVFKYPVPNDCQSLRYSITPTCIQIGNSFLRRKHCIRDDARPPSRYTLRPLHQALRPMKALIKCMEMNWMAVLVGTAGVGKSSLVELLAELSGNHLHILPMNSATDTTELLGGFEQADLRRDLEQISKKVWHLVKSIRYHLLKAEPNSQRLCDTMQSQWLECSRYIFSGDSALTAENEMQLFRTKLSSLRGVIDLAASVVLSHKLHSLQPECTEQQVSIERVQRQLEENQSLNCGGQFVWTDSILVKCLRDGHWLLIDNVNFCSASVLDRLNALLEPNGCLVISERGIIDGTIPTIKPHPDFRLILAMDPRHGELSRAMRNRGIEICIIGENEPHHGFDDYDIRLMIHDRGVSDNGLADALVALHGKMCAECVGAGGGKLFSVSHLLRAADLFARWMKHGISVSPALLETAVDVYVRDVHDYSISQRLLSAVNDFLPVVLGQDGPQSIPPDCVSFAWTSRSLAAVQPRPLPSANDWCADIALASVRTSCALFLHITDQIKKSDVEPLKLSAIDCQLHVLNRMLLENCPVGFLGGLSAFVEQSLGDCRVSACGSFASVAAVSQLARNLPEVILRPLDAVMRHPNLSRLQELAQDVCCEEDSWNHHQFDWRWNASHMTRRIVTAHRRGLVIENALWEEVSGLSNIVYLHHQLAQYQVLYDNLCQIAADSTDAHRVTANSSLLQLSLSCRRHQSVSSYHPCIGYLATFIGDLLSELIGHTASRRILDNENFLKITKRLQWLWKFMQISSQPLEKRSKDECIAELAMHWNWLNEKLLVTLDYHGVILSPRLRETIQRLHVILGTDGRVTKVQEAFRLAIGRPVPFRNIAESRAYLDVIQVSQHMLSSVNADANLVKRIFSPEVLDLKQRIVGDMMSDGLGLTTDGIFAAAERLQTVLNATSDEENSQVSSQADCLVTLSPLFECLALHFESHLAAFTGQEVFLSRYNSLQQFVKFSCRRTVASMSSIISWASLAAADSNVERLAHVFCCYLAHLMRAIYPLSRVDSSAASEMDGRAAAAAASPHCLSSIIVSLLADDGVERRSEATQLSLPSVVTLGDSDSRLLQLSTLGRVLWLNASFINSREFDLLDNNYRMCTSVVNHLTSTLCRQFSVNLQNVTENFQNVHTPMSDIAEVLDSSDESESLLSALVPGWNRRLAQCMRSLAKLNSTANTGKHYHFMACLGEAWVQLGLLQAQLLLPRGPVDPNYRLSVRLSYAMRDLDNVERELDLRLWYEHLLTGVCKLSSVHPIIEDLYASQGHLKSSVEQRSKLVAFRSEHVQFLRLLQDMNQFMGGIGSPERISSLANRLSAAVKDGKLVDNSIQEQIIVMQSFNSFATRMEREYHNYRDLTVPFLCASAEIQHGLNLMARAARVHVIRKKVVRSADCDLEDVVRVMGSFPVVSEATSVKRTVQALVSDEFHGILTPGNLKMDPSAPSAVSHADMQSRLLHIALLYTANWAADSRCLDEWTVNQLTTVCRRYVDLWRQLEETRRLQEEEEKSLYRYRTETFGDTLTEEQRDENEIKSMFPSFQHEFEDIENLSLTSCDDDKVTAVVPSATTSDAVLSDDDMNTIHTLHTSLFTSLAVSNWYQGNLGQLPKLSLVQPVLLKYRVLSELVRCWQNMLDPSVDKDVLGCHLMACSVLHTVVGSEADDGETTGLHTPQNQAYDVYRDSNVKEVVKCRSVLDDLLKRVNQLLAEFPEWPTLVQIVRLIERIKSFSVTSPLMRFVTGLEMVLQASQLWDRDAASSLKLTVQLEQVVKLIKHWRNIEYRCWKSCLNTVVDNIRRGSSRWWFHIYSFLEPYINRQECDDKQKSPGELLEALETFMESSSVGEYTARLEMLLAFHCHLLSVSEASDTICNLFWNVYQYYQQFQSNVEDYVTKTRADVEKSIQGTVKSIPWMRRDVNYFNYDIASWEIHKVHKSLHRDMKAFKQQMLQPVRSFLTDNEADLAAATASTSGDIMSSFDNVSSESEGTAEIDPVLVKCSRRISVFCRRLMRKCKYSDKVNSLNNFTGELIECVHELQSLKVDETRPKDKQKSDAKHIVHRRRKSLSDLFHFLELLGLSFKKGLVKLNMYSSEQMVRCFTISPGSIADALRQLQADRHDQWTSDVCKDSSKYFLRCISRRRLFHTALETPSTELDRGSIERCRGFAEHLSYEVGRQRQCMAEHINSFIALRKRVQSIRRLGVGDMNFLPLQSTANSFLASLKETVDEALHCLRQVELALNCAPLAVQPVADCESPLSPAMCSELSSLSTAVRGDEQWSAVNNAIKESVSILQSVQAWLCSEVKGIILFTGSDMTSAAKHISKLKQVTEQLSKMDSLCSNPNTEEKWFLGSAIQHVAALIFSLTSRYDSLEMQMLSDSRTCTSETNSVAESDYVHKIDCQLNSVKESIMRIIQVLYKKLQNDADVDSKEVKTEDKTAEDGETVDEMNRNLITEHLGKKLTEDLAVLKISRMTTLLDDFLNCASISQSVLESTYAARRLRDLLPALTEYTRLVQFYLTHHIAGLRASAKLLSVLLSIFASLAQKGFCTPAEFNDEAENDGATKFEDIEGGGLGDGEGAKDVSEQIESEDQLEEGRQANEKQEAKQENDQEIPAEDNAVEMTDDFDGTLHDGEQTAGSERDSDSDEEMDEKELDQQMGDLGDEDCEKLDEQMWGSDDEDQPTESEKEELGPGAGQQNQPELGAKDDTGEQPQDKKQDKKDKDAGSQPQPECLDETEYEEPDPTNVMPELPKTGEEEPQMELPDDMNLGEDENEKDNGGLDNENEDEMDLDKQLEEAQNAAAEEEEADKGQSEETEKPVDEEPPVEEETNDENHDETGKNHENKDNMESDEKDQEGNSTDQAGLQAPEEQDDGKEKDESGEKDKTDSNRDQSGTLHSTADVQQAESAQSVAGSSDMPEDKQDGTGVSATEDNSGHEGNDSCSVSTGVSGQDERRSQRRPGQSSENRTVGSSDEKVERNLQTVDNITEEPKSDGSTQEQPRKSSCYEHIRDAKTRHDAQTMDAATESQQQIMQRPKDEQEETTDKDITEDDFHMLKDKELKALENATPDAAKASKTSDSKTGSEQMETDEPEDKKNVETDGSVVATYEVERGPQSSIHTNLSLLSLNESEMNVDNMRRIVEEELQTFSRGTPEEEREAMVLWQHYDTLTSSLAQELCEQLRMVLAPTLAAKFKGGFRTGKRPCMRRVIEYIASDYRKDKFWLRRVEPNKRQYQVMVAIDDSASMVFNHSKQLAFESLSVITNALTKLEVGNVGVCSFGETTRVLHRLEDTFTAESGSRILRQLTFEQQKTDVTQLLDSVMEQMTSSRSSLRHTGTMGADTSQLLVIVSDGHGLGDRTKLKAAVRRASEARVFLVFVILENPGKPDIFKMTVCEFEEDLKTNKKVMKLSNYMETFPFPFYVVIRDVESLPLTLSDALRQWFELVTAADR